MRLPQRSLRQTTLHFSEISFAPQTGQTESGSTGSSSRGSGAGSSDVEPELDDIAVLHDVFLALDPKLRVFLRFRE